nr:DUF364 domain-containing protein [Halomonas socia]
MVHLTTDTAEAHSEDDRMAKSAARRAIDTMPWQRAEALLTVAGWSLRDLPGGQVMLAVAGGRECGLLLDCRPDPEEEVDGHGLLRSAGGGGLDTALAESVASTLLVDEVLVGLNWTLVRAGAHCGIARSPSRDTQGARSVRTNSPIAGRPLADLAGWLCSLDPLRRSIGLAAINAFWNTPDGPAATHETGLDRLDPPGDGLVVVGGFRDALAHLPMARVIEREPKGNDIPADSAAEALAEAKAIVITAQTLMNGSLEPLLPRIGHIPVRLLLGPSAPMAPLLLDQGLTAVSGLAVTAPDATRAFIAETGAKIMLDHLTRPLELEQ